MICEIPNTIHRVGSSRSSDFDGIPPDTEGVILSRSNVWGNVPNARGVAEVGSWRDSAQNDTQACRKKLSKIHRLL